MCSPCIIALAAAAYASEGWRGIPEADMGEKERGAAAAEARTRAGNTVALDDDRGAVREGAPGAETAVEEDEGAGAAALKTRHDTVKNSIGNIR